MSGTQCKCKKGYISLWDGKCGNCRTKQEQREHDKTMVAMPEFIPFVHRWVYLPLKAKLEAGQVKS